MAEEKKDNVSADTEAGKAEETKDAAETPEIKETAAGTEEPKQEEKTAAQKKAEKKKKKSQESKEKKAAQQEEEKPKKSAFIGDLNYLEEVRKDLPAIKPGDLVRMSYRVIEGGKERTQIFEGTVIAIKNSGIAKTITVRKTSFGIAVERIFPLNSKLVQAIEVKKHSRVRRAKLYYLRNLRGKAARLKELR
ncbi:MAG: 50S ribosomal protein L19 [Candidatus Aminicenantes bacterium]|nr:50S ribosomal protein L19 [Candidatus Aminicenantes bacterium]